MTPLKTLLDWSIRALLVLFPIGTVWIFSVPMVRGSVWQFGVERIYASEVLVWIMVFLFYTFFLFRRNKDSFSKKIWKEGGGGALLVAGVLFVSSFLAVNQSIAFQSLRMLVSVFVAYAFVSFAKKENTHIGQYILFGAIPVLLLGLWQWGNQTTVESTLFGLSLHARDVAGTSVVVEEFGGRYMRAYSSFPHPNIFGGYAAFLLLYLFVYKKRNLVDRVLVSVLLPLAAAGLVVSWSRSAYLALICGTIGLVCLRSFLWKRIVPVIAVCCIAFFLYPSLFFTRTSSSGAAEIRSIEERLGGIEEALSGFAWNRPFGVGPGNYTAYLHETHQTPGYLLQPVHNTPLLMLVELGWLGSVSIFIAIFFFFRKEAILLWQTKAPLFLAIAPIAFFDHYLWSTYQGILLVSIFLAVFNAKEGYPYSSN